MPWFFTWSSPSIIVALLCVLAAQLTCPILILDSSFLTPEPRAFSTLLSVFYRGFHVAALLLCAWWCRQSSRPQVAFVCAFIRYWLVIASYAVLPRLHLFLTATSGLDWFEQLSLGYTSGQFPASNTQWIVYIPKPVFSDYFEGLVFMLPFGIGVGLLCGAYLYARKRRAARVTLQ
jgi:hypothetical protein